MNWTDSEVGIRVAIGDIDMGAGNGSVSLFRSEVNSIVMGDGIDTIALNNAGARTIDMGDGDDLVRLSLPNMTLSLPELAQVQKDPSQPMILDGGAQDDTLNLLGSWTIVLSSGSVSLDYDSDGIADTVTHVFSDADVPFILGGYPSVLDGTVYHGLTTTVFRNFEEIRVICFTAGTRIDTPTGQVAVEALREGDLVTTRNGARPVQWIGRRTLDSIDLAGNPKMLPIKVPAGAFGIGLPKRSVSFSPQHRVVVRSTIAERMFGSAEVLVSVKQLVGVNGIDVDSDVRSVQYVHIMLDAHQIMSVEGIEAESLYPGRQAISFLNEDQLREIREIFPNLDDLVEADQPTVSALPFLKGRESRALAARHIKNDRPLYA